jgi:hypothetical protein
VVNQAQDRLATVVKLTVLSLGFRRYTYESRAAPLADGSMAAALANALPMLSGSCASVLLNVVPSSMCRRLRGWDAAA